MKILLCLVISLGISFAAPNPRIDYNNELKNHIKPEDNLVLREQTKKTFSTKNEIVENGRKSLSDDLNDFIELIPLEEIEEISNRALETDGAIAAVVQYLQSDRWKNFVDEVLVKPGARDLIEYLTNAGVPIEDILVAIEESIDSATPGVEADETGSLRPFLDAIREKIPVVKLLGLLNEKLGSSTEFQNFYIFVAGKDRKAFVDEVLQMDEAVYVQGRLTSMGVNVAGVWATIYDFLAWGAPPTY